MLFLKKLVACAVMCVSMGCVSFNANANVNTQIYNRTASNKSSDASSQTYKINPRVLQLAADNGAYVGIGFGNLWSDWNDQPRPSGIEGDDGFTFNLDLGYQWNQYLAAEFGYVYFPSASHLSAYATYVAAKMLVVLPYRFNLFVKAGVAYHHLNIQGDTSFFSPVFAGGVAYAFLDNLSANLQYMYLGGDSNLGGNLGVTRVPSGNSITVGLDYNLSV